MAAKRKSKKVATEYYNLDITYEMTEAGAVALARLGIGGDGPMGDLQRAAEDAFEAMIGVWHKDAKAGAKKRRKTRGRVLPSAPPVSW